MAIQKYIIEKSDLTTLLRGEDLAIQPKGNIKGFCVRQKMGSEAWFDPIIDILYDYLDVLEEVEQEQENGNVDR